MTDEREARAAAAVIETLGMQAHPEGGWYVETWRAPEDPSGARPSASAILFLLAAGERSHWHRLDAAEVWQWSAGDALELLVWSEGDPAVRITRLGGDVAAGDRPQSVVPAGDWASFGLARNSVARARCRPGLPAWFWSVGGIRTTVSVCASPSTSTTPAKPGATCA